MRTHRLGHLDAVPGLPDRGLGALALHAVLGFGGAGLDGLFEEDIYMALMFGAASSVLARAALQPEQRARR